MTANLRHCKIDPPLRHALTLTGTIARLHPDDHRPADQVGSTTAIGATELQRPDGIVAAGTVRNDDGGWQMTGFHVLGGIRITRESVDLAIGGPRQRRLLAGLLVHRGSVVSTDRLADIVFAGEPPPGVSTTMRSYVARLRRILDQSALAPDSVADVDGGPADDVGSAPRTAARRPVPELRRQPPGYVLVAADDAVDAASFERHLAEARSRIDKGDADGAAQAAKRGLAMWAGPAYAEFADEDWARPEAQRLEELRLVAHELVVDAGLIAGRAVEVLPELESLVHDYPMRETLRAQLVLALYRTGRQADALAVLHEGRRVLIDELGLDPSPVLIELERRVLVHDPTLLPVEPVARSLRGYRLGERLGSGRDGTVYAARLPDADADADIVVRVIRAEIADDPAFIRSFDATAHRVASLRHPAVMAMHDHWREPGVAFVVTRRMHGGTLADRLARRRLETAEMTQLVTRVGGALVDAAERGIVHGRIDPASIFYDTADEPYLGDFELGHAGAALLPAVDVHDFAALLGDASEDPPRAVAEVLSRATSSFGRPGMAELVRDLVVALTGTDASTERPNPYKGLRPFDEADSEDFFGRSQLLDELVRRLAGGDPADRLILVVGASGSGKSSLVRAGLLPMVRRGVMPASERWFIATMLPGSSPFKELAHALQSVAVDEMPGLADQLADGVAGIDRVLRQLVPDGGELVLVIDQLEELFTTASSAEQQAFLAGIVHAVTANDGRLRVVATLRADFYDRPLAVPGFGPLVHDATCAITAMRPADLEAAIVEPAERVGGGVERALVAELVTAVVDQSAALPSLQYTLWVLAERNPSRELTLAAYHELGGLSGSIAARAEAVHAALGESEQAAVRQVFERLVVVDGGTPTRRRVERSELSALDRRSGASIERWVDARLLTIDRDPRTRVPTVEVAHEALLTEWPRLRGWIDESRADLIVLGRLDHAASDWDALGRDPAALYRGAVLEAAVEVVTRRGVGRPELERAFLDASTAARENEARAEAELLTRQIRANRRLRVQLAAIGVAFVVALVGGIVALDQRADADRQRRVAGARELAAAAVANLSTDPELGILLALEAVERTRSRDGAVLPEAEEALHRAVTASRVVLTVPGIGGAVDWSPDGTLFVTEGPEESGIIDLRDAATGTTVRSFHGHDVDVNDVVFSRDGELLASAGDDGAVRVWDPHTGEELMSYVDDEGAAIATALAFSPDGSLVSASWLVDDIFRVIEVASGDVVTEVAGLGAFDASFDPEGSRVVAGDLRAGDAVLIDVVSGREVHRLTDGSPLDVRSVDWSPDGKRIATSADDGAARIWDAATGGLEMLVTAHVGHISAVAWSPDSTRLATAGTDRTAVVSEIVEHGARGVLTLVGEGTQSGAYDVAFSPDGESLLVGDLGVSTTTVWDVRDVGGAEWLNVAASPSTWDAASFTPAGDVVLHLGDDRIGVFDTVTGKRTFELDLPSGSGGHVSLLSLSPDGELLAIHTEGDGEGPTASLIELASGTAVVAVPAVVSDFSWSADGAFLATGFIGDEASGIVVVDRSGTELARWESPPGWYYSSVSMSPDGTEVAVTKGHFDRDDPTLMDVEVWDWRAATVVRRFGGDIPWRAVTFDASGTRVVTIAALQSPVAIWDALAGEQLTALANAPLASDAAFSPDGAHVATGHGDGTVRVWDARDGRARLVLHGHAEWIETVEFSNDGTKLVSVDSLGVARVWALDLEDLMEIARERLTRGLSDGECRQYLRQDRCPA